MKFIVMIALFGSASFAHADGRRVSSPSECSNAGDEVARPVYEKRNGQWVLVGWECVQDNRGGNGG